LKSQPEYPVRRLAVFVGYGEPEMGTVWSRTAPPRERADPEEEGEPGPRVIELATARRDADLQRAA
jgi:hypothetical protein